MLGILEPKAESTPGTVLLVDKGATAASGIKHGHGKNSDIILVPTPTDEPDNVAKLTFTPLITLLNPAVLWAIALRCWCSCCTLRLQFIYLFPIWSVPPYNLNAAQNVYLYVGAVIGGIIGCLSRSWLCVVISNALTKINGGIYEPEFRIPAQGIPAILYGIGCLYILRFSESDDRDIHYPDAH
ncbi:hypothetical protein M432DRAFT_592891 [Thermoascus aurantiacus ATCC 26904]